jgi:hypothetical protein
MNIYENSILLEESQLVKDTLNLALQGLDFSVEEDLTKYLSIIPTVRSDGLDYISAIRKNRDIELTLSDWTQLPDTNVDKTAWANYRQALRDVPQQEGFPYSIIWPAKPA